MAVGKKVGGFLYVHRAAVPLVEEALRDALSAAERLVGDDGWNVAKLSKTAVSLLTYEDFDEHAFPALLRAATVDLARGVPTVTDYSKRANPPILHRKELLVPPDDPRLPAYRAVTRKAEEHGLFSESKTIGTRRAWEGKVEAAGLRISGGALVEAKSAEVAVSREKTAIVRPGLSAPVSIMLKSGIMREGFELFDYGCGHGRDLEILKENGFEAFGWDPSHRPNGPRRPADVVNLGFVVNVIENRYEREETLKAAWSFAKRALVVSAMLVYKADVRGQTPHGDGYLTSWSTFQKYYTQDELLKWVSDTLGHRANSLGQGVVGIFRDEDLEQEVFFTQRSRAAALAERLRVPRRERPPRTERPGFADRIADEVQALWQLSLELGRLPQDRDVPEPVASSLAGKSASVRRAVAVLADTYDLDGLQEVAKARREDLLVFGALSMFPGSPRFSALPARMQRDVKHFFGSHAEFMEQSTHLLMRLKDGKAIEEAFSISAATGGATNREGRLAFETERLGSLDPLVRIMVGCADIVSPGFSESDVVEIGPAPNRMRAYACENYSNPLPRVAMTVTVDLGRPWARTARPADAVLYGKSRFMASDDPGEAKQRALDDRLKAAGVVSDSHEGPTARDLARLLSQRKAATDPGIA